MIGVIAFIGITPIELGNTLNSVQANDMNVPARIVAGRSTTWFDEFNINLATCGTISPKKPIGPQYAVTIAVKNPEIINSVLRRFLML